MDQKKRLNFIFVTSISVLLWGCKPQPEVMQSSVKQETSIKTQQSTATPLVVAQMEQMVLAQPQVCPLNEPCWQYRIDWAKTNLDWLNQALLAIMQTHDAAPFTAVNAAPTQNPALDPIEKNAKTLVLRYLGQHEALASFVLHSQSYDVTKSQGTYHDQYILFDLNHKQRVNLSDLIQANMQEAVLDALYAYHGEMLAQYQIQRQNLTLVDNFYLNPHGVVFVYPKNQFSKGLIELTLPYDATRGLIQARYLPSTWAFVVDE